MSMQSWRDEFYPERALDLAERLRRAPEPETARAALERLCGAPETAPEPETARAALEHSLRKWRGLRPEALARHEVELVCNNSRLQPRNASAAVLDSFGTSAATCALCQLYCTQPHREVDPCRACPLARSRGGAACDVTANAEVRSPWFAFVESGDPEPMIAALERALNAEAPPPPRPWAWERTPAEDTEGGAL